MENQRGLIPHDRPLVFWSDSPSSQSWWAVTEPNGFHAQINLTCILPKWASIRNMDFQDGGSQTIAHENLWGELIWNEESHSSAHGLAGLR